MDASSQPPSLPVPLPETALRADPGPSFLKRTVFAPVKFLAGLLMVQSPLGAVMLTGWTSRLMQRVVLWTWWRAAKDRPKSFAEFVATENATAGHVHWPNWILDQSFSSKVSAEPPLSQKLRRFITGLFLSLWENGRLGSQMVLNTSLVLLPSMLLMWTGWFSGWQVSFNKQYEHVAVGASVSLIGIVLFVAAMFYAPLALARQASTGDWRRFYDFKLVRGLVKRAWFGNVLVAGGHAAASLPVIAMMVGPTFFAQGNTRATELSPAVVEQNLRLYYLVCALWVFPAFVLLRCATAYLYGRTVLKAVQSGALGEDDLAENEWHSFRRLGLLDDVVPAKRSLWTELVLWFGTKAGRITAGFMVAGLWFLVVGQISYVATFFSYRFAFSWINQPLIFLPWFMHLPAHIEDQWGPVGVAFLVLFAAWRIQRLVKWVQAKKAALARSDA